MLCFVNYNNTCIRLLICNIFILVSSINAFCHLNIALKPTKSPTKINPPPTKLLGGNDSLI